jgi:hypothetical protein
MGVRITDEENVALYDSTSGQAFGPIFPSREEAADFLEWLVIEADEEATFQYRSMDVPFRADPRQYDGKELDEAYRIWIETVRDFDVT